MKKVKYIMLIALAAIALNFSSCSLDEFNPSGATADVIFASEEGLNSLVNAAYVNLESQFYGREDMVLFLVGGNDLFLNIGNGTYGRQMSKYQETTPAVGQFYNDFNRFYEGINYCNAGLERIEGVEFTSQDEKDAREGELRFLRAYYYWHLVEIYGNCDLRTTETQSFDQYAYRSPYSDFYDLIIGDLQIACQKLPVDPFPSTDVGRATKKAAYGLLARTALTRASGYYSAMYNDADTYYTIARDAAVYVINNQAELKTSLYDTPGEIFDYRNNKSNSEALFVVTHARTSGLNPRESNPNRLHQYFKAAYSSAYSDGNNLMVKDLEYGDDKRARPGAMSMMPTKYLLELYDDENDARYGAFFRDVYYCNSENGYTWQAGSTDMINYQKDGSVVGTSIAAGDTAIFYSKHPIADKATRPYACFDIDDTYDPVTGRVTTDAFKQVRFPALKKYDDPTRGSVNVDGSDAIPTSDRGTLDVIMIRLAEMYLVAAEANVGLNNPSGALPYINELRERAAVPGKETAMRVSQSDMTLDFILDERARELCGEHLRWMDLKRTGKPADYIRDRNLDIWEYLQASPQMALLRPIPERFLLQILNADEFGQNPGY